MERRLPEDELDLGLPPLDGGEDEEQPAAAPGDDADLDLDTLGDSEEVGLDAASGSDEHFDLSELIGSSEGEESQRWTPDSEAAEDLAGAEPDVMHGDEDGWTEDCEAAEDGDYEAEGVVSLIPPDASSEDGGEEGVDEKEGREVPAGEDDETALPPLDPGGEGEEGEDDEEAFGRKLLDEMADGGIPDE